MSLHSEYTAKMKHQLDELNTRLTELDAKTAEAKADAQEIYKAEIAKLRAQSRLAVAKFEELKITSEGSWDKAVAEMDKIRDAFTHSFSYFKSQI
jgi:ATP/maltotriose-dependent transcriptional regulator MalT